MHGYREKFLATDFSVAINSTKVDVTHFTSLQWNLSHVEHVALTLYVLGANAACSKDVTFKFATYDSKRATWDTIDFPGLGDGLTLAANGTTAAQRSYPLSPAIEKIKLLSVTNAETVAGYTVTVNASIYAKENP